MTTWRKKILETMAFHDDAWEMIEACTLSPEELDAEFDAGYGVTNGLPFTVWTRSRVYFPCCYNGSEWCESVARHPDGKPTKHCGND